MISNGGNEKLKVCVAVCNYNHEQYLEQSIRSILNQDHELLDVVVVDDGSTNNEADASREDQVVA